ncbi:MAG: hypothetical protein HY883_03505, partial [Deltaproteobacteria bacterium]|nr:hypothetical protein [Deltaproteobacteria bacterium]
KIERIGAATEELKAAVKVVGAAENNKRLVEAAKRLDETVKIFRL